MTGRRTPWGATAVLATFVLVVVASPVLPLAGPDDTTAGTPMSGPSRSHLLGTDHLGRDLLARVLEGGRTSLVVGAVAVMVAGLAGGAIGMVAGYVGGAADAVASFVTDVMVSVPVLLIGAAVVALVPARGPFLVATVIGIAYLPICVRLTRNLTRGIAGEAFVLAAHAMGARPARIIARTIAPQLIRPTAAIASVATASAIAVEGAFGYLGLSAPAPTATWGGMLAAGSAVADRGLWPTMVPAAAIVVTIGALTLLGDSVGARRDLPGIFR